MEADRGPSKPLITPLHLGWPLWGTPRTSYDLCVHTYVPGRTQMNVCVYTHTHTHTPVCVCVCVSAHVNVQRHMSPYTHNCFLHAHMLVRTCVCAFLAVKFGARFLKSVSWLCNRGTNSLDEVGRWKMNFKADWQPLDFLTRSHKTSQWIVRLKLPVQNLKS